MEEDKMIYIYRDDGELFASYKEKKGKKPIWTIGNSSLEGEMSSTTLRAVVAGFRAGEAFTKMKKESARDGGEAGNLQDAIDEAVDEGDVASW